MSKEFFESVDLKVDVSREKVLEIMDIIVNQIQKHNGSWTASIFALIGMSGEKKDRQTYAIYIRALDMAAKDYKLKWKHAGRNGRKYYMELNDKATYIHFRQHDGEELAIRQNITIVCPHCKVPMNYVLTLEPLSLHL